MKDKSKLFAFCPGETLLEKLERLKNALKLSPSEVRKAMSRGGEQMLHNPDLLPSQIEIEQMQCNERGTLLTLLRKKQGGINLTRSEWSYLAQVCNRTYDSVYHTVDVVDRKLLSDNLRAFASVIAVRDSQIPELADKGDHYYLGNMGFSWVERKEGRGRLQAHVEDSVAGLPEPANVGAAAFATRNLDVALRDEPILDVNALNSALRPYLHSLLLVALRGYWEENKTPIITSADKSDGWPKNEEELTMSTFVEIKRCFNDHFSIEPVADETAIGVAVEAKHHPFIFALNNYVELTQFIGLINQVDSTRKTASMPGFEFHLIDFPAKMMPRYMLASGRWRHFFSEEEYCALKDIFFKFQGMPDVKAHLETLENIYGRI